MIPPPKRAAAQLHVAAPAVMPALPTLPLPPPTHHTHVSAAEAAVEQPCPMSAPEDYSVPLHLAAVFILLGVSLLGSLAPVALHLSGSSRGVTTAVKLGSFFGERCLSLWLCLMPLCK